MFFRKEGGVAGGGKNGGGAAGRSASSPAAVPKAVGGGEEKGGRVKFIDWQVLLFSEGTKFLTFFFALSIVDVFPPFFVFCFSGLFLFYCTL